MKVQTTDYEQDLAKIESDIADLTHATRTEQITRRAYRFYQRAALSGRLDHFALAESVIQEALDQIGPWPDLCLIKANLDMKFHRLSETKQDLGMAPGLSESPTGRAIWADIHFQEGRYYEAREACLALVSDERSWDTFARLAYWESKFGTTSQAERLYDQAEDELTAKEMRGYAWVELQKGLLDLRRGLYEEAAAHYQRAESAYTGYWLVDDHMAELLGTQGRYEEAIALYERVLAENDRPELQQAFGELYVTMGEQREADRWLDQALHGFLDASEKGGVHYYHHLVDFYSDVRENSGEAVAWAIKDLALRRNFATEAALAWALFLDGQTSEANSLMDRALASGVRDAHLFAKAATIRTAAGKLQEGQDLSRRASQMNPNHQGFHVHRA